MEEMEMELSLSLMERPGEVEKSKRQNWSEECGKDRYTQGTEPGQDGVLSGGLGTLNGERRTGPIIIIQGDT